MNHTTAAPAVSGSMASDSMVMDAGAIPATAAPAERNPALVYIARLGEGSRRAQHGALDTMAALLSSGSATAEAFPWHGLRYRHTAALRAALMDRYAPATVNRHLAALRGVLKEAWRLGLMDAQDYEAARDVAAARGKTLPRGRALSTGELRALAGTCDTTTPIGARDAALLAALYTCGLRRSEAVALDMGDYHAESGRLTIRHGKGDKAREVYITNGAKRAMGTWLHHRGTAPGPLFPPIAKGNRIQDRRMTAQGIYDVLLRRAEAADVAAFTPHDLRRTMISDLLDAGADIVAVQRLAGHSNVATTARYDRRGEAAKMKAAGLLHFPFGG